MAKQTTKALPSDKLSSLALGGSAAAVILLPQAITKAVPQLFTRVAPYTAQTLPLLHGRLRQLWRQLSWQLNRHRFFSNAS